MTAAFHIDSGSRICRPNCPKHERHAVLVVQDVLEVAEAVILSGVIRGSGFELPSGDSMPRVIAQENYP